MSSLFTLRRLQCALIPFFALPMLAHAQTAPAQKPLLSSSSGARSNVMLVMDNSGSMAWAFTDTYWVTNSTNANTAVSPATTPATFSNPWLAQRASEVNSIYYDPRITYLPRVDSNNVPLVPGSTTNGITAPPNVRFVSNANSRRMFYSIVRDNDSAKTDAAADTRSSFYEEHTMACGTGTRYCLNNAVWPQEHPRQQRWIADGAGVLRNFNNTAIVTTNNPNDSFVYFVCGQLTAGETDPPTVVRDASNRETGCNFRASQYSRTGTTITGTHVREIVWGRTQNIVIPFNHNRTDCASAAANICTNQEETNNIINWYKYYGTRADATATAIGLALASPSLQGGLRIGYYNLNRQGSTNSELVGVANAPARLRGVRLFDVTGNTSDTRNIYSWLYGYGSTPRGGTPLHQPLINVGEYYRSNQTSQTENPWVINPTGAITAANAELSCRRSYSVVFSDGAWSSGTATMPPGSGGSTNFVGTNGPTFTGTFNSQPTSFSYRPTGPVLSNVITRRDYTPYPSGTGRRNGLADVAAYYNWHADLRTSLPNSIATKAGKPTFWQNMSTYTVGYLVRPSGASGGSGLTFDQINAYRSSYYLNGLGVGSGTVLPAWPTTNLDSASESDRIDDFLHAGYAGGARAYSVANADEVRRAFEAIFAETSDGGGNDAGVSVALTTPGGVSSVNDAAKYTTEYTTGGNSGDLKAYSLDANGIAIDANTSDTNPLTPSWSANDRINQRIVSEGNTNWRRLFTYQGGASATLHDGSTTISTPSTALMSELDPTGYFPTDGRQMIRYLLGDDTRLDRSGVPMRKRSSLIGASVNAGPLLVFNNQDMAYYYPAQRTDTSNNAVIDEDIDIHGRTTYVSHLTQKESFPPVVMLANNNGTVQVFNAAKITTPSTGETDLRPLGGGSRLKAGDELASFMPSGLGSKLRLLSDETFIFQYMLDGRLSEEDIFQKTLGGTGDSQVGNWRQIVVGTSGRAAAGTTDDAGLVPGKGRFIYALNAPFVTEANGEKKRIPSQADFLWERSWPTLGHVTNITTAGQLSSASQHGDNEWVVLSNSGHYTEGGPAGLYVLNALTGAQIGFIPTTANSGRGLGGVVALRDKYRRIIGAYAGDEQGNLWRFSLTGTWSATRMFTTANNRPIYAAPSVQLAREGRFRKSTGGVSESCTTNVLDGKCGTIVVVGTGILLADTDRTNQDLQAIYGIWDPTEVSASVSGAWVPAHTGILNQNIVAGSATASTGTNAVTNVTTLYRVTTNPIDYQTTHMGWRLDIGNVIPNTAGERVVTDVGNVGRAVVVTSTVVTTANDSLESCARVDTNANVIYALRAEDGANIAAFRNTLGQLRNFSVGFTAAGGFTNSILAGRTGAGNPNDLSTFNPYSVGKTNESIIADDKSNANCTETGVGIKASKDGFAEDNCLKTDWQRTWRQLASPPN